MEQGREVTPARAQLPLSEQCKQGSDTDFTC
jgi:hypothetical protein